MSKNVKLAKAIKSMSEKDFREFQRKIGYYGERESLIADLMDMNTDVLDSLGLDCLADASHVVADTIDDTVRSFWKIF